jgi:hypothetical protein
MGIEHYKRMYEDAVKLDCKAFPLALELVNRTQNPIVFENEPGIWETKSFDEAMRAARKLVRLYEEHFLAELREMAAEGLVQMRAPTLPTVPHGATSEEAARIALAATVAPPKVVTTDPAYIGSDDFELHRGTFGHYMRIY